jgi:type III secretion system FlhB-like substrate exporter
MRVVGVKYAPGDVAPTVVLKGTEASADAILRQAEQHENLAIVRDPALVEQLYRVPIDGAVGKELFPVMAVLLAHILHIDGSRGRASDE